MTPATPEAPIRPHDWDNMHPDVQHRLSNLAIVYEHNQPSDVSPGIFYRDLTGGQLMFDHTHGTLADKYPLERAKDPQDSAEKLAMLQMIGQTIAFEASAQQDKRHIDWHTVAAGLVARAEQARGREHETALASAVAAVQFSENLTDRVEFLQQIYDKGLQKDVYAACEHSPVVLLLDKSGAAPLSDGVVATGSLQGFAKAFQVEEGQAKRYLETIADDEQAAPAQALPSAKRVQKDIVASYDDSTVDRAELRRTAEQVGGTSEKVSSTLRDLYKVERFALQYVFIERQMQDVLADAGGGKNALAKALEDARTGPGNVVDAHQFSQAEVTPLLLLYRKLAQLQSDTQNSFQLLSQPTEAVFSLDGADIDRPETLTKEQGVALRYNQVTAMLADDLDLARFVDIRKFVEQAENAGILLSIADPNVTLGALSSSGAAAPTMAKDLIENVARGALENEELTAKPQELRDFAYDYRRKFQRLATHHISDFGLAETSAMLTVLKYNDAGKLELENDFSLPAKESLDVYAAIALGCPALRALYENNTGDSDAAQAHRADLQIAQRAVKGSSNYINHVLTAVINEAYERGIFDIEALRREATELEAQRQLQLAGQHSS